MARKTRKGLISAFTLTEVLIVIAIIAVLAALLAPALETAKADAFKASSTSDLRQTFVASSLYSNDYDDRVPYAVDDCAWRGLCRCLWNPSFCQQIQEDHTPPFSQALKPYGFDRTLFRIQAGQGPRVYALDGTSYAYGLILSSAALQPLGDHGCPYFYERGANFWNGGVYDTNVEPGERWLTLYFNGQVKFSLYNGVFPVADACRAYAP